MTFRQATLRDLPEIDRIIADAAVRMNAQGNFQWNEKYPTAEHIVIDIHNEAGFVLCDEGKVLAYGAVVYTGEPSYAEIEGEWLSDDDYVVVHRMAVSQHETGHGVATKFLRAVEHMSAEKGIRSFKVDTNFNNNAMLHLLEKEGFAHCGTIYLERGSRMAFEKLI